MSQSSDQQLMTRRRSLALAGAAASGLVVAGASKWINVPGAGVAEASDYVAMAATACTLTAEQEEGPFYVALDRVRSDIVEAQPGLPLTLKITIINSQTCKPLKGAAVDIWQANASGAYSDESSQSSLGQTYLRGVLFTDKHGQVAFKTIYPGHYQGRTTHIHAKVHIASRDAKGKLTGGHVAHTGQLFPSDATNAEVYTLSQYRGDTAAVVTHAQDMVWTAQHGSESQIRITKAGSRLGNGLVGAIVLAVNPNAVPAAVGVGGAR
jgi:protocatechuate 3,4-dioxygenase beta subunit